MQNLPFGQLCRIFSQEFGKLLLRKEKVYGTASKSGIERILQEHIRRYGLHSKCIGKDNRSQPPPGAVQPNEVLSKRTNKTSVLPYSLQ